jgi:hypothetical protein
MKNVCTPRKAQFSANRGSHRYLMTNGSTKESSLFCQVPSGACWNGLWRAGGVAPCCVVLASPPSGSPCRLSIFRSCSGSVRKLKTAGARSGSFEIRQFQRSPQRRQTHVLSTRSDDPPSSRSQAVSLETSSTQGWCSLPTACRSSRPTISRTLRTAARLKIQRAHSLVGPPQSQAALN